jgi:glucan biosynthesis protein C
MPLFFLVAGFFGALLFFERSPKKMIKNRVDRLLYPFVVFVFLLWPTIIFSFGYTATVFAVSDTATETALAPYLSLFGILVPQSTFHLWFLYYLLLITIVSYGLGLLFNRLPKITNKTTEIFNWVIKKPLLKLVIFSGLTTIVLFIMDSVWVATSNQWIPDLNTFIFYFFFYIVGWILFKSKNLISTFMQFDLLFTGLAIALVTFEFIMLSSLSFEVQIVINSVLVWLFIFGITGLFIRFGSQHSHLMRYNSDSSYWIYLIHLSFTAFIPGLIAIWQVPAFAKFVFVLVLTSVICLVTYHYFVRATFIGKFLNGRKYSRNVHAKLEPIEIKIQTSK